MMTRSLCYLGLVAVIVAWVVIGVSWYTNPWFNVWEDAYSDLGGPKAIWPEIYNYGLIITGIIIIVYGIYISTIFTNKLGVIGSSYLALAGLFLALIGIYPSGTRPHTFVSTWFFIQADLSLILIGLGLERGFVKKLVSTISIAAFPVAILVELAVGWPSTAILEAYGILIIDLGVILVSYEVCKK